MMLKRLPNNCYCKERCPLCNKWFDCDLDFYYRLEKVGLVCYDCGAKIEKVENAWSVS